MSGPTDCTTGMSLEQLEAAVKKPLIGLLAQIAAMQAVVNAASILDHASDNAENDCMDEAFELQAALVKYRATLAKAAPVTDCSHGYPLTLCPICTATGVRS